MNQRVRIPIIGLMAILIASGPTQADVISVEASADSRIDAFQPDTAFPTGDLIAAKEGTPETIGTQLTFFYAQFDLPDGLTGQDILTLNSAQLRLTRTGPDLSLTYYVYGILDGLDIASADTFTWNSGIGINPANNLIKFLSADEIDYYSDPAKSVFVGTISTAQPGAGPFDFTSTPQSPTAVANLHNLILDDTDGRLTFYVGVRQNFAVTSLNTMASIENANLDGPTLVLDFVPVPEPSSLMTVILGAAILGLFGQPRGSRQ